MNNKKFHFKQILCASFAFFCASGITAQTSTPLSMPSLFSDHIVLQQEDSVSIWGWGEAGKTIQVVGSWSPTDTLSIRADPSGRWIGKLKTTRHGGPYTLEVFTKGRTWDKIVLQDVMLGEVWLCSGQSNMEWSPNNGLVNQKEEIKTANYPNLRFFSLAKQGSHTLQDNCRGCWEPCTPEVMRKRSAVAYFFGRHLHRELNVPIGLIVSAWGGTPAEVWIPKDSLPDTAETRKIAASRKYQSWPVETGTLYNSMIHPLLPYRIAGAIWYQGESNRDFPQSYARLMETLISSWRKGFGHEFPFYLVQIAPHNYKSKNNGPALIREAQEQVTRRVPHTGLVVTNDIGEYADIHPKNKQAVGLRLGNLALGEHYGTLKEEYQSPALKQATKEGKKIILTFEHTEEGLTCPDKNIRGVYVAGEDGKFVEAKARIKRNRLEVSAREIKSPVTVRYCFDDATVGNLFNKQGLPMTPFQTTILPQ